MIVQIIHKEAVYLLSAKYTINHYTKGFSNCEYMKKSAIFNSSKIVLFFEHCLRNY